MKDSKFIELVNLYIDHQITPEDAALLEAEIQQKPERRRIYRHYCQMQKACMTLAENFRSDAAGNDKVVEMESRPRRLAMITYAMGVAAAAACVALVVVNRPAGNNSLVSSPLAAVNEALAPSAEVVAALAVRTDITADRPVLQPAFPGLGRESADNTEAVSTASHVPLDWMQQVHFERVSNDTLRFESLPALQTHDLTLRSARPYEGQVETTAFIFAK
jgi:hypothetical protein